jgi:hypothetical protein
MGVREWINNVLHPGISHRSIEARAIYFAVSSGVIAALLGLLYFSTKEGTIPIWGRVSIGTTSIVLASLAAFIAYFYVLLQNRAEEVHPSRWRRFYLYLGKFSLSFIHGALVFLITTLLFYIVSEAFIGAMVDKYASSVIVGVTVGVISYGIYLIASNKTTMMVSAALAAFLVAGALTSMITAQDPYWWQIHLSSLGTANDFSAYAFNVTLIIGGLVILCIADFIAQDFARLTELNSKYERANVSRLRLILVLMGLCFAGVGLFPFDTMAVLHGLCASAMLLLFVILIFSLRKLVPPFSHAFFALSYGMLAAVAFCYVLFQFVGYLDLTVFEIISFVILFGWLVVFIRQIAAAQHDEEHKKLL